jgi:hypothetical protein
MFSAKLLFLVFIALATTCDAHRIKCDTVCPPLYFDLSKTVGENFRRFFDVPNGPQDGICLKGDKYIIRGDRVAPELKENRCVCRVTDTEFKKPCSDNRQDIKACKPVPPFDLSTNVGDFFRSLKLLNIDFTADGCCQPGDTKDIVLDYQSEYGSNVCYCVPPMQ